MAIAFINIVLLVAVDLAGHTAKGAQRWLSLGPVSFQPSELAKLAITLLGAAYLGEGHGTGEETLSCESFFLCCGDHRPPCFQAA